MALPRVTDYVSVFFDELRARLGSTVDLSEGSQWDALGGALGAMFVRSNKVQLEAFDAHTRETASGTDLDDYCSKRGPIVRFPASKAKGICEWIRATAGFGATSVPAGHRIRAPYQGKTYVFEVLGTKGLGASELVVVADVQAILAGAESNVGQQSAGVVNLDTLDDATLLPNVMLVSGGSPAETDDELRYRQRLYEQSFERGTLAAIELGALMVPGVKKVVLAMRDDAHLGGQGRIYVGDRDWYTSDTMLRDVAAKLEDFRGLRSISVAGMLNSDVTIAGTLEMARPVAAYDAEEIRLAAVRRIVEYFDNRKTPYEYSVQSLAGRVERAHDEAVRATITSPATSTTNPLSATALAVSGFPAYLTRYRTHASLINIEIKGPS